MTIYVATTIDHFGTPQEYVLLEHFGTIAPVEQMNDVLRETCLDLVNHPETTTTVCRLDRGDIWGVWVWSKFKNELVRVR